MLEKDFHSSLTFKFFNECLNVELLKHRFDYVINSIDSSHEHRFILKYRRIFYNIRGVINYAEIKMQGIPMTESILIVHAIVKNRVQKLRTKVKCSLNEEEKKEALKKFKSEFIDKLISICTIGLNELPNELKIEICKYLNLISLINLAHSNSFWYDFILSDDILWKHLYIRDFGNNQQLEPNSNWKLMYRNELVKRRFNKNNENRWVYRSLPGLPVFPALPYWNHDRPDIDLDQLIPFDPLNPLRLLRPAFRRIGFFNNNPDELNY